MPGTGNGVGLGQGGGGKGGIGGPGPGGDNSNSGPKGKLNDVKDTSKVHSQQGESGTIFNAGETKGVPDTVAPSKVPYTEVLPTYTKAAENAIDKEKVPPAYRKRVKEYFGSLQ